MGGYGWWRVGTGLAEGSSITTMENNGPGSSVWVDSLGELQVEKPLTILTVNVRSLHRQLHRIRDLNLQEACSVLILTEIWRIHSLANVGIKGFRLMTVAQRANLKSGGVAIYVKDGVEAEEIPQLCKTFQDAYEVTAVKVKLLGIWYLVVGHYRSPQQNLATGSKIAKEILVQANSIGVSRAVHAGDVNVCAFDKGPKTLQWFKVGRSTIFLML